MGGGDKPIVRRPRALKNTETIPTKKYMYIQYHGEGYGCKQQQQKENLFIWQ